MSQPKNEAAKEKRYMDLVLDVLQSPHWKGQGKAFFGKTKTPAHIVEMRDKLLTDPNFTMQKLQEFVKGIEEKKSRSPDTRALYNLLKSDESLDIKIAKIANLKRGIENLMHQGLNENSNKPSFK